MRLSLIPKDIKFFDLFAAAGNNLAEAADGLRDLVENFDRLDQRIAGIQRLEKRGDQIDRDINKRLEDSFVAPFDREDIHELTVRIDDVVDYVQAVGESLAIYDVKVAHGRCRATRPDPRRTGQGACQRAHEPRGDEGCHGPSAEDPRVGARGGWRVTRRDRSAVS